MRRDAWALLSEDQKIRHRAAKRRWRAKNPDKVTRYNKRYWNGIGQYHPKYGRGNQPPKRWAHIRKRYGIDEKGYDLLFAEQKGLCAICNQPETVKFKDGRIKPLNIDHDHETTRIRGLLCWRCNVAIGLLQDDAEVFLAAAEYLKQTGP